MSAPHAFVKTSAEDWKRLSPPKLGFGWGSYILLSPHWELAGEGVSQPNLNINGVVNWAMSGPTILMEPTETSPGIRYRYAYMKQPPGRAHNETEKVRRQRVAKLELRSAFVLVDSTVGSYNNSIGVF